MTPSVLRSPGGFAPCPNSQVREHVVCFYQENDSLITSLCGSIGPALGAGGAAIIIAAKVHRDRLKHQLTAGGLDIQEASEQGRYVEVDAPEILTKIMVEGMPDRARFVETFGRTIVRTGAVLKGEHSEILIFGEMVSLLWMDGRIEAAIRLEQLWNELAKKHSFSLRCAYPIANFYGENKTQSLFRVCAEHSALVLDKSNVATSHDGKIALCQSEERFRMLVDAAQDYAIFMLDTQGYITSWNTGAERIKGYRISEIIGKHFSVFYPEEDRRSGKPQRELEIAARDGRLEDEGWRLRKDGSLFWANVIITALRDEAGRLVGFGKVTRDFTDRIRASEALQKEIDEKTKAEQKLQHSEKSLRLLSRRLLQTQDEERRRISRDLHDSVGQCLAALKMKLDSFKSLAERNQPADIGGLDECTQLTEEAIKEVRTISHLLHPPLLEELGLKSVIPWYLEGFTKRSGIKTALEIAPDFGRIANDVELALFRVLQESLTNIHRHSGSQTASVRLLTKNRVVILQVADEGKGFQVKLDDSSQEWVGRLGVGMRGMNERMRQLGGCLELTSTEGGTTVTASVPIREAEADLSQEK